MINNTSFWSLQVQGPFSLGVLLCCLMDDLLGLHLAFILDTCSSLMHSSLKSLWRQLTFQRPQSQMYVPWRADSQCKNVWVQHLNIFVIIIKGLNSTHNQQGFIDLTDIHRTFHPKRQNALSDYPWNKMNTVCGP